MLRFNVNNQNIIRNDSFLPVADSKNYLYADFEFSEEWQGEVVAVFGGADGKFYDIIVEENRCLVPWEVIKAPFFTVSVFCGDLLTSNIARVDVEKSGYAEGQPRQEPTPDIYNQILSSNMPPYIGENGNWYVWDKEQKIYGDSGQPSRGSQGIQGEQGNQGERGEKGEKGDTPTPDVTSQNPETLAVNTIYDLGVQNALALNLPSAKISDFIQVDFLSGDTPTTLTITSSSGLSEFDLVPEANVIYSLYFDYGVLYYDATATEYVYGWRVGYADYVPSEV